MQFESYIGPGNDGIFARVEITDFTPSTAPSFYAHPEEDDGEPATVEWRFVDDDGNRDDDLHIAATEADYERITQEAIDVAQSAARRGRSPVKPRSRTCGQYAPTCWLAVDTSLLQHLSPLGWEHINLTGDYVWRNSTKAGVGKFRPLRPLPKA